MTVRKKMIDSENLRVELPHPNDLLTKDDLMVLVESGQELTAQVDLDELLQRILTKACELTESPDSSVILYNIEKDTLYFAAATGEKAEFLLTNWGENSNQQVPLKGSKAGQVFESGRSIIVNSFEDDSVHYKGVDSTTSKHTDSMICSPLMVQNEPIGVVQILNKDGIYTERDLVLLEYFSSQAAIAIRNASLFADLIAHMGFYGSNEKGKGPIEIIQELEKTARSEVLTVLFADMRGFTQLAQTLNSPENTQNRLNEFLTMLAEEVIKHNGIINKFLGDGLMAIFRDHNHPKRALLTAFSMLDSFDKIKSVWNDETNQVLDWLDIGIGIATDSVIVGAMGGKRVRDFTVIGNAVNLASIFECNARDGKRILVDNITYQKARDIIGDFDGPSEFVLQKPGQSIGVPYKQYHVKSLKSPEETYVFLSHCSDDRDFAKKRIVEPLGRFGIHTWYAPDDIPKGGEWIRAIEEGFGKCQWMAVIVSKASVQSEWVRREVDLAVADPKKKGRIISILIDDTKPEDLNKFLSIMQYIDARDEPRIAEMLRNQILAEITAKKS
jgi:class 3 adenylate cyclase